MMVIQHDGMLRKHFLLQVFFTTNTRHGYHILKIKNHHVQIEIKKYLLKEELQFPLSS